MNNPYKPLSELEPKDPPTLKEAPSRVWGVWGLLSAFCFAAIGVPKGYSTAMLEVVTVILYIFRAAFAVKCILSHTGLVEKFDGWGIVADARRFDRR